MNKNMFFKDPSLMAQIGVSPIRLIFVLQHHNYVHPCKEDILRRRMDELRQETQKCLAALFKNS